MQSDKQSYKKTALQKVDVNAGQPARKKNKNSKSSDESMDYASFTKNGSNGAIKAGATVELTAGNLKKTAEQEVKTTERGNQKFIKLSRTKVLMQKIDLLVDGMDKQVKINQELRREGAWCKEQLAALSAQQEDSMEVQQKKTYDEELEDIIDLLHDLPNYQDFLEEETREEEEGVVEGEAVGEGK